MKDLLFKDNDTLIGIEDSTRENQKNILVHHKGWNKDYPHLGVGIMDYIHDDGEVSDTKSNIELELEKDGMIVNAVKVQSNGKIDIDADY